MYWSTLIVWWLKTMDCKPQFPLLLLTVIKKQKTSFACTAVSPMPLIQAECSSFKRRKRLPYCGRGVEGRGRGGEREWESAAAAAAAAVTSLCSISSCSDSLCCQQKHQEFCFPGKVTVQRRKNVCVCGVWGCCSLTPASSVLKVQGSVKQLFVRDLTSYCTVRRSFPYPFIWSL